MLVFVEFMTWVGSNINIDSNEPGGHYFPNYISIPLFITVLLVSFQVALLLARKIDEMDAARYKRVLISLLLFLTAALFGVYGYFRRESPGVLIYAWDAHVSCCVPAGDYSGMFVLTGSISALLALIGYNIAALIRGSK